MSIPDEADYFEDYDPQPGDLDEKDDSQEFTVTMHREAAISGLDFLDLTRQALATLARQARAAGCRPLWNTAELHTDVEQQEIRTFGSDYRMDGIHTITATLTGVPRT